MQVGRFWIIPMVVILLNAFPIFTMDQWCSCNCSFTLGNRVAPQPAQPAPHQAAAPADQQMPDESPRTVSTSYAQVAPQSPMTIVITRPGEEEQQDPPTVITTPTTELPGSVPQA